MANRILTDEERNTLANPIIKTVRQLIDQAAGGDLELRFAINRKVAKELTYDERSKPSVRKSLKAKKRLTQGGKCAMGDHDLGEEPVLDRLNAIGGYKDANTRLICRSCDSKTQRSRGYR